MVKVTGPVLSLTARGWLGRWQYGRLGLVRSPYPIALLGKIHSPYRMPAFGLRPYPSFISQYYSPKGWCYQLRRTWHGIVWSAIHPPISNQPRTSVQQGYQMVFYDAVKAWQGLTEAEKRIYNAYSYPVHASGYNRFIRWYLKTHTSMPLYWGNLEKSVADSSLIEDDMVSQTDPHISYPFQFNHLQMFNAVLHKGAGFPDAPAEGQIFYRESDDKFYIYKDPAGWTEVGAGSGMDTRIATVIVAADGSGDFTDIQDGIYDLPVAGGMVFVKDGTYNISTPLVIAKSNVVLCGQSMATQIFLANGSNCDILRIGDAASIYEGIFVENLYLNGNRANNTGLIDAIRIYDKVSKVYIRGCWLYDFRYYHMEVLGTNSEIEVTGCKLSGEGNGIAFTNCTYVKVEGNQISVLGANSVAFYTCTSCFVIGNYLEMLGFIGATIASVWFSSSSKAKIVGNEIKVTYGWLAFLTSCTEVLVSGNQFTGGTYGGLGSYYSFGVDVVSNTFYICAGPAVYIGFAGHWVISGNRFERIKSQAISLYAGYNVAISGNVVANSSQDQAGLYDAISLDGGSRYNIIKGNSFKNSLTNKPRWNVYENSNSENFNLIEGNICDGFYTGNISGRGSYTKVLENITV